MIEPTHSHTTGTNPVTHCSCYFQFETLNLSHNSSSFNAADYSGTFYDDSDADVEQASTLGSTIFDVNNMLGVLDAEIYHPM